jgi:hypothetical protein
MTLFDYPAVLRRPAGEILTLFNAGGTRLILTWHAFAFLALLFVPLAAAEGTFNLINLYGGVAIGEHIGQLMTALKCPPFAKCTKAVCQFPDTTAFTQGATATALKVYDQQDP